MGVLLLIYRTPAVKWDDVAGLEKAKQSLLKIVILPTMTEEIYLQDSGSLLEALAEEPPMYIESLGTVLDLALQRHIPIDMKVHRGSQMRAKFAINTRQLICSLDTQEE